MEELKEEIKAEEVKEAEAKEAAETTETETAEVKPEAEEECETEVKAEKEPEETMADYASEINKTLRKLHVGDVMEGEVISFDENGVLLDLNYYETGRIPANEMSGDPSFSIMSDVKLGDRYTVVVKSVDDGRGYILLSRKEAESESAWDKLEKMKKEETVIEGTIKDVVKGGAILYVEGVRGFIPASKLALEYVEDTAEYLNKKISVRVFEADKETGKLILSAREILRAKQVEERKKNTENFTVGSTVTGTVQTIKDYGAFVDLGNGISGLIHVSQITDKRIAHPKFALKVGQTVEAKIIKIENGKISLSMRALTEDVQLAEEEDEPHEYKSEYVPNNPFAELLKKYTK